MSDAKRDRFGRFLPGVSGNLTGRPPSPFPIKEYWAVMRDAMTLDDWRIITHRAIVDARNGDAAARRWLSTTVLGGDDPRLLSSEGVKVIVEWASSPTDNGGESDGD